MKNKILAALSLVMMSQGAMADTNASSGMKVSFGVLGGHHKDKSKGEGSEKDVKFSGGIYGGHVAACYHFANGFFAGTEFDLVGGNTRRKDDNFVDNDPEKSIKFSTRRYDVRVLGGYEFPSAANAPKLAVFGGVGYYRQKYSFNDSDKFSQTVSRLIEKNIIPSNGKYSFDKTTQYTYLIVGTHATQWFNPCWGMKVAAELNLGISGSRKYDVQAGSEQDSLKWNVKTPMGARLSIDALYKNASNLVFSFGPYASVWSDPKTKKGKNNKGKELREDNKRTIYEFGASAKVRFSL